MKIKIKEGYKYFQCFSSFDSSVSVELIDSKNEEITVISFKQLCGIVEFQTIQGIDFAEFLYIPEKAFECISGLEFIDFNRLVSK